MITEETISRVKSSLQATKSFLALEVIERLEKENAELKEQNKLLSEKESYWEEQSKLKDSQLEEQDRLAIFTVARFDELKAKLETIKELVTDYDMCRYDKDNFINKVMSVIKGVDL